MMHGKSYCKCIIYNRYIRYFKEAIKANAKTVTGVKMLIYQGIESFKFGLVLNPRLIVNEALVKVLK